MINLENVIWAYSPLSYPWCSDSEHTVCSFAQISWAEDRFSASVKPLMTSVLQSHLSSAHWFPVKFRIRLSQRKYKGLQMVLGGIFIFNNKKRKANLNHFNGCSSEKEIASTNQIYFLVCILWDFDISLNYPCYICLHLSTKAWQYWQFSP